MGTVAGAADWERLYREEFPRVYRALLIVLRDRELALDAVHDAFLEGLRRPPRSDENLAGWLFTVALRTGRRGLRRRWRELVLPVRQRQPSEVEAVLDRDEVGRLLALLTPRQRAMVIGEYYLDLSQEELARAFGVQRGTVAATLAQARSRMRAGGQDVS